MSMRQPERAKAKGQRVRAKATRHAPSRPPAVAAPFALTPSPFPLSLMFDICHLSRPQSPEEGGRLLAVELRVAGLDEQEEAVARGEREVRRVEDRVVRLR